MEAVERKREIEKLRAAIKRNPASDAYFPLAQHYFSLEDYRKAFETCFYGLKKHPNFYDGYILLGEILVAVKQYERAEKTFATAFKLDPSRSDPLFLLCEVYISSDNLPKLTAVMHQLEIVAPYDMRLQRIREIVAELKKENRTTKNKTGRAPLPMTDAVENNQADVEKIITKTRISPMKDESLLNVKPAKHVDESVGRQAIEAPPDFDFSAFMSQVFELKGIKGMVFVNPQGQIQRSTDFDIDIAKSLAKLLKLYTKAFNKSLNVLNFGQWIEVTVLLDDGFVFILNLGTYKIAFQCSDDVSLGSLRAKLRNILSDFNLNYSA